MTRYATSYDHARALGDRDVPAGDDAVEFDAPASPTANEAGFGYARFEDAVPYVLRFMD